MEVRMTVTTCIAGSGDEVATPGSAQAKRSQSKPGKNLVSAQPARKSASAQCSPLTKRTQRGATGHRLASLLLLLLCSLTLAADDLVNVTFEVTVPASTPADARVCIAGNAPQLGAWKEDGVVMTRRDADGVYVAQLKLPRGAAVRYKVTRGSWLTVEKTGDGSEMANRSDAPAGDATVKITVAAWADQVAREPVKSTRTGDIRVHEHFASKHLGNQRRLLVWLPPGYEKDADARYPVLYMHDGQNLFDAATSFAGEWQADETAARLIAARKIRPLIIVAIENNDSRMDEYTLTRDEAMKAGGNGTAYLKFVAEEVKPFIDKTYRTKPDRADTAVAGSSLGGTISLELCRAYPQSFGLCGAVSPAAWWNDGELLKRFDCDAAWMKQTRFWIDVGTAEGDAEHHAKPVGAVRELEATMKKAGLAADRDYAIRIIEGGLHNEHAWAKRFDQVLMFLFPP
jgi:predicted alpha/beta superfamily hydrolase